MTKREPQVLIVDDQPERAAETIAQSLRGRKLRVAVEHPEDVDAVQLGGVDVLLVDYDLRDWAQVNVQASNYCSTGWSLAAVLRDRARLVDTRRTAVATALLTSEVDAATIPFTSASRQHIAAELNGIEWVFDKTDSMLAERVVSLAEATQVVKREWSNSDLMKALGVSRAHHSRHDDVLRCRPPLSESMQWQDGLGVLRWMLHRILPYPTFLIDEAQLSARLGVSVVDVRRLIDGRTKLAKELAGQRYDGMLSQFLGPRWWRVGIDSMLWGITEGRPSDSALVYGLVRKALKSLSDPLPEDALNLVVCYDESLCPLDRPVDAAFAVRVWPDDWPPYALQPWATAESVANSQGLRRIALPFEAGQ